MLTIRDMHNRINYLKRVLPMYQEELAGLEILASVYDNPEYAALKALEQMDQPGSKITDRQKAIKEQNPNGFDAFTDHTTIPKEVWSITKLLDKINERPQIIRLIRSKRMGPSKILIDAKTAKYNGVSTTTLSKIIHSLVYHDMLIKTGTSYRWNPKNDILQRKLKSNQ